MPRPNEGVNNSNFARASSFNNTGGGSNVNKEPTREERIALKETEDENKRKGLFKRIFPSRDFPYYRQFFAEERPLNVFLDSRLMAKKRDNTHAARLMNEKQPHFLQPHYQSLAKESILNGVSPASGTGEETNLMMAPK